MAELIAAGTTEADSADFTLAAGDQATLFLKDAAGPSVSSLNFVAGQTIPNLVKVKVGTGGKVSFFNPTGTVHVIDGGWSN